MGHSPPIMSPYRPQEDLGDLRGGRGGAALVGGPPGRRRGLRGRLRAAAHRGAPLGASYAVSR